MVPFFTITLLISIIGIISLLLIKQWESTRGVVLASAIRPRIGAFFHNVSVWVERILPALMRVYLRRSVNALRALTHRLLALAVLAVEHGLESSLHFLRTATSARHVAGEASVFLREVAEHKRRLLKGRVQQKAVVKE